MVAFWQCLTFISIILLNIMPYSLLDPVQVNKLLLKAFHCRSLSSASHTSCIFDMAVKLNKPCTDTVWYLSDCPLPSHPGGWLCMKLSATELLTSSHLFLIQPFLWSPGTEMRALYTLLFPGCWLSLYTSLFLNFWGSGYIRTSSGPALLVTNSDTWSSSRCRTALRCRKLLQSLSCQVMPALLCAC